MTAFLLGLILGSIIGAVLISRWWTARMSQPEVAAEFLREMYSKAHPHWLRPSPTANTLVCPVCGWTEERGEQARSPDADWIIDPPR